MIDRAALQVAALRGLLLAVALALAYPPTQRIVFGALEDPLGTVAFGAFLGALAMPCACLEAIARRRGGGWVVCMALAAWATSAVAYLWFQPALAYARMGGGLDGLAAAQAALLGGVGWSGVGWRLAWACAYGSMYGALTLGRGAGAGVIAQGLLVTSTSGAVGALGTWCVPEARLLDELPDFWAAQRMALSIATPLGLVVVGGAWLGEGIRSSPVPAASMTGAVPCTIVALVLSVAPAWALRRTPDAAARERVAVALRLVGGGGRTRWLALRALRFDAPGTARRLLLELGAAEDPAIVEHVDAFHGRWSELSTLLRHEEGSVRGLAVRALGRLRDPRSVVALASALWDGDALARDAALDALLLHPWSRDERDPFRAEIARSPDVHERARALLSHRSPDVRERALALIELTWAAQDAERRRASRVALEAMAAEEPEPALRVRVSALLAGSGCGEDLPP